MGTLRAGGIRVHADDLNAFWQEHDKLVLDALGSHAIGAQVATAAVGAARGGVRVGAHGPAAAAGAAHERVGSLVVRECRRAVRALGHAPALAAHEEIREAAPVQEQHGLLAPSGHALERTAQGLREDRARATAELRRHVNDADLGEHGAAGPLGHLHARPARTAPRAYLAAAKALERGRGGAQHQRAAPLLRHARRDLAGVIALGSSPARRRTRAPPSMMMRANVGERRKERGARTHHHMDGALAQRGSDWSKKRSPVDRREWSTATLSPNRERKRPTGPGRGARSPGTRTRAALARGRGRALDGLEADLRSCRDPVTPSTRTTMPLAARERASSTAATAASWPVARAAPRTWGLRRGERGFLAATNLPACLDRHHPALCEGAHSRRGRRGW